MAVLNFTLVKQNTLGPNENVTVQDPVSGLNAFLASTGTEKYILSSLNIWSSDREQVKQPVTLIKDDPDGNGVRYVKVPQLDSYQTNNNLNDIAMSDFPFDSDSRIEYVLKPSAMVKFTMNFDDKVRNKLNSTQRLKEATGFYDTIDKQVIRDMGFSEIEEEIAGKKSIMPRLIVIEPEEEQVSADTPDKLQKMIFGEPEEGVFKQKTSVQFKSEEKKKSKKPAKKKTKDKVTDKKKVSGSLLQKTDLILALTAIGSLALYLYINDE